MSADDAVRTTNDDATSCKRAAVDRGYWKDPYIQYFVRGSSERKPPEINRGYFARVQGVQCLLRQFLELTKCQCQVINLGAGFDTTYWNLKDQGLTPLQFIEVDFDGVTAKKCYYIQNRRPLLECLESQGEVKFSQTDLHSTTYHIVAADLRNLAQLQEKLSSCQIKMDVPTMFIAECVLIYMTPDSSCNLLKWIADKFSVAFFANYEQVNMDDRFGQVMVDNLQQRGCQLAGVKHCISLDTQKDRFLSTGWDGAEALDMVAVYKNLPQQDIDRVQKLEFLDECEVFEQLLHHYCICVSYRDTGDHGLSALTLRR